ncbi:MAG: hypothetical protein II916_02390 [Oscillospiraceae bacterium]|nr:hypothetical protein [Oscillospiraceae bacterium]
MGTQFWWFYDALAVVMTAGIVYAVVAKGFNKVVFQLAAFAVAILVGVLGANFLAPKVYDELFRSSIEGSIQSVLDDEEFDIYEQVSENLALSAAEDEETMDAETLHKTFQRVQNAPTPAFEDWYLTAFGNVFAQRLNNVKKFHPIVGKPTAAEALAADPVQMFGVLSTLESRSNTPLRAQLLTEALYRDNYTQLVRLALFLIIELVMLIICSIISSMTGDLEESMHLRRADHVMAFPVALVEVAAMLMVVCVTVRLIAQITDGEMLLFNQPTIDQTYIFRFIYQAQDAIFGIRS